MNRVLAVAAAATLTLTACSGLTVDQEGSEIARYNWDGGAAMAALAEGTVVNMGGCIVIELTDAEAGTLLLPYFPRAFTEWFGGGRFSYDGKNYAEGDFIAFGGGGPSALPSDAETPKACEGVDAEPFLVQGF